MIHRLAWKHGLAAATLAALATGPALAADAVLSLVATPSPGIVGAPVTLEVALTDIVDLYAYQFSLSFDPTLLQATTVTEGALLPAGGATFFIDGSIDNTVGSISFVLGSLLGAVPGVTGNGVLANIGFNVVQAGSSALNFSDVLLLDSNLLDITVQAQNGVLPTTVVPEPATWLLFGLGLAGVAGIARRRETARA